MRKIKIGLICLCLCLLFAACKAEKRTVIIKETNQSAEKKLRDDEAMDKLLHSFEEAKLLTTINGDFNIEQDSLNQESYKKAEKIIEFDIIPETGNESLGIIFPPNEMRTGKVLLFKDFKDATAFKEELSNNFLIDYLNVDTNEIEPILMIHPERKLVLMLNKFISDSQVDKYQQLFTDI